MANSYIELMKIVNQGNKMGLSNTITRDNGIPLDLSSVQESYEAAVIYAATKAIAYQGQLLAAEGVVYVIVADSQGEYEAADGTKYQNYLKPVGTAPKGDDASISVTADGLVSLYGFASAENGKLPMKVDGTIIWKSLEDIGAGDGNDDTTYTFELNAAKNGIVVTPLFNGQPIMEGEGDAQTQKKFEIVLDVYTKAEADEKFLAKADYTPYDDTELEGRVKAIEDDYLKAADKYDDTDIKGRLDAIEGDYLKAADKYDDTALAGRVTTLETASADHETRIGKVEEFFTTADGESLDKALDTLIEIQKEIASDNEGAAAMVADIAANTSAIATLNGDAATEGSVAKKIADAVAPLATTEALETVKATADAAAVATEVEAALATKVDADAYATDKATFATKQELTDHSNTMATTLNDYAKKADVEGDLAKKIETATIAHTSEGVAEGATVEGANLRIVIDAYTKAETVAKIDEVIDQINDNSETAASVAADLAQYEEDNNARVALIETKNSEQDTAIAAAQTQADKGVADAKTANDAIVTINETLGTHGNDISAVKGRLATLETAKGDHETRIATAEGKVTTLETTTANNSKAIGELQGADAAHTAEDERLAGLIDTKANAADVYTKGDIDTTISGINTELGKKANAADVYTKTEVDDALANLDQSELEAGIQANTDAIAALIGEDTGKTIRAIAAEETAAIVAGADAKYDTLKEIADFIINDETGAAAMANDIAALKTTVDTGDKTVSAYVADQLAAIVQPKASTEISVATDGTLGINKMSVEKLDVPEGVEFILFGGGAQPKTTVTE